MLDFHTNLFVLKQQDFGDLDRVVTVFTSDYGKRIVKLTSSYKFLSKLNSNIQPFSLINCDIVVGKSFDKICNASVDKVYSNMFGDLRKNIAYFFITEIVRKQMDFNFADKKIYNLCVGYFDFINDMNLKDDNVIDSINFDRDKALVKVLYGFFVNFLRLNGHGIVLSDNKKILNNIDFFNFINNNLEYNLEIGKFFS